MREIKFRCWEKEPINKFIEYFEVTMNGEVFFGTDDQTLIQDRYVLQQFTGLLDSNGEEIYEGDIIDFAGLKPIEIIWEEGGFKSSMLGGEPIKLNQEGFSAFAEIIGNIYESSELLKEMK